MLSEKLLFWPHKIPDYVTFLVASGLMGVAVHYFVPNPLLLAIIYFPMLLAFEAVSRSSRFMGFLNAKISLVALLFVTALLVAAYVILILHGQAIPVVDSLSSNSMFAFVIIGMMLGLALAECWQRMAFLALVGKKRLNQILLINAIWSLGVIFYPQVPHGLSGPWYLVGISVGVLLHKGSRLRLNQAAAAYRRLEDIADAWPPKAAAPPAEQEALKLLAEGRQLPSMRFRTLRRKLDDWRASNGFTKRLALVSASVFRLEGEFDRAIAEASIVNGAPQEVVDAHLLLLTAMSLDELGRYDESEEVLERVLTSEAGKDCPLANSLNALKLAEKALARVNSVAPSKEPLRQMHKSMDLRAAILRKRKKLPSDGEESVDSFLGRFLEIGVPIKASLSVDILGYCHLAAGYAEEAGVMFQRCIEIDPAFSPAYLHLGDYFLFRSILSHGSPLASRSDLWHASACYYTALNIERNSSSRIRRQARERLDQVAYLLEGRSEIRAEAEPIDV